ncbi:MAG: hypothetical protein OXG70_06345 [Cyanobacteria bacterium MAG IRC1_bin_28]|nr:hypothetical protein [Cyanobacteria bacterium MAG IRC1_bin_28]MDE0647894.1 hypothetical protein [Cyanobacteria bacterium MAG IRC4_bin_6]
MAALQGFDGGGDLQDKLLTLHARVEHMHDQLRRQAARRRTTAQDEPRLMSTSG